mmetsp:Transcript_18889/g.58982  ORF Transcript_18889/g.58982 Transcript_18889/m.58982 type:complete len:93 (-) Transcript_18889:2984-3262(-)
MRATGLVAHLALANFATANVAARADDEVWRPLADALAAYPAIHARELGKLSRGDPSARVVFAVTRKGPRPPRGDRTSPSTRSRPPLIVWTRS